MSYNAFEIRNLIPIRKPCIILGITGNAIEEWKSYIRKAIISVDYEKFLNLLHR